MTRWQWTAAIGCTVLGVWSLAGHGAAQSSAAGAAAPAQPVQAAPATAPAQPAPPAQKPAPAQTVAPVQPAAPAVPPPAATLPDATSPSALPVAPVAPSAPPPAQPEVPSPASAPAQPAESPSLDVAAPRAPPAPPPSAASPAPSDAAPAFDPDTRSYTGFSVRLGAGLGLASAKRNLAKGSSKVSGFDAGVSLDIGAAAIENLIVYGRLAGFALNHANNSDSPNAGSAYFGLLGAGARYHFMPIDWYASGTLSLAAVSVTSDLGVVENAHPGFGLEIETGKDWWAGTYLDKRAIGLGLRFAYVRCGSIGNQASKPWIGTALSVVFSASYN
jgi:hypothetical protein